MLNILTTLSLFTSKKDVYQNKLESVQIEEFLLLTLLVTINFVGLLQKVFNMVYIKNALLYIST